MTDRPTILSTQARFSATPLDLLHPSLATSSIASIEPLIASLGIFQVSSSSGQRLVVKVDATSGVTRVGAVVNAPAAASNIGDTPVLARVVVSGTMSYRLVFVDAVTGEEKKDLVQALDLGGARGTVEMIVGVVFSSKKDTGLTYRLVVAMEDHSIAMVCELTSTGWRCE